MVTAICKKCTGTAEGKTKAEAADNIDHAIGLGKGRPCPGGPGADVSFEGETVKIPEVAPKVETVVVKKKFKSRK